MICETFRCQLKSINFGYIYDDVGYFSIRIRYTGFLLM